jgi:hypothetical protein
MRVLLEKVTVRSTSQETPHPLLYQMVHHRVHKSLSPVQTHFSSINFNILPSRPRSYEWVSSHQSLRLKRISHLRHACYMHQQTHPPSSITLKIHVKITNHAAPQNAIFSSLLSLHPSMSKYSPQHPVHKYSQSVFFH